MTAEQLKSLQVPKGNPDWAQESASKENQASRNKKNWKHKRTIWKYYSKSLSSRRIISSCRRNYPYWIQPRTLKTQTECFLLQVPPATINHQYNKLQLTKQNRQANHQSQQCTPEIWESRPKSNLNRTLLLWSRRCQQRHHQNHRLRSWKYSKQLVAETMLTRWIKACRFHSRSKTSMMRTTWIWMTA